MTYRFAVGTYTKIEGHVPEGRGDGISILELDYESESCKRLSVASDVVNPTFLCYDGNRSILYSISEEPLEYDTVKSWFIDEQWNLNLLTGKRLKGRSGCHISILPNKDQLYAASYSDGVFSVFRLKNGIIESLVHEVELTGNGPNNSRQEAAHTHQVLPDPNGRYLYVCDLGTDTVWMHRLKTITRPPSVALKTPAGFGPRHIAFDPLSGYAFVVCELVSKLLVAEIDPESGSMKIIQELDTVGKDRMEKAAPAAVKINPSGRTIAVSNRFDDSISVFTINRGAGLSLTLADNFSCRGKTTRDMEFTPDGRILAIANQDSHDIQFRQFDGETGLPVDNWCHKFGIGSPACIVMI